MEEADDSKRVDKAELKERDKTVVTGETTVKKN